MGRASELLFGRYGATGLRIVLADANPTTRARLAESLRSDGHAVLEIVGATQLVFALQVVADGLGPTPDAVIVDVTMGDGAALELLESYKSTPIAPFVALLGPHGAPKDYPRVDPGAVFARPFDEYDLRTAILNAPLSQRFKSARRAAVA